MKHGKNNLYRITISLAVVAPVLSAQADWADRADEFVQAELKRQNVPGVAVAVVRNGEVILARGYGYANVEHRVPVTADTMFQSASLAKQFTSALVMLLVEDGRLRLDDSITVYLTGAPDAWKPVTIRHLLTHTSGIPDNVDNLDL